MLDLIRKRLSVKIVVMVTLFAVPLAVACVWRVVVDEQEAVEEAVIAKGKVAALTGATAYGQILESGVASGELKLEDLINPTYEEIVYPGIRVSAKSYHTKFDRFTDAHGIEAIEDAFLADPDIEFASGIDSGGYVPTTISRYQVEPNGDPIHDQNARKKRKYNTIEHLVAAHYTGDEPLVQPYLQDKTKKSMWCVVVEIRVAGKHFGAFRVGVLRDQIALRGKEIAIRLAWLLGGTLVAILLTMLVLIQLSMRPLTRLVGVATRLSLDAAGSELDKRISEPGINEVSQMAKALDRLRQSVRGSIRMHLNQGL